MMILLARGFLVVEGLFIFAVFFFVAERRHLGGRQQSQRGVR